jgi:hypothetical protein
MTHIAGPAIHVGFTIQRCSLCGAILIDSRGTAMPITEKDPNPKISTWEVGRLVRVETGNPICWTLLENTDRLPDDSCIDII